MGPTASGSYLAIVPKPVNNDSDMQYHLGYRYMGYLTYAVHISHIFNTLYDNKIPNPVHALLSTTKRILHDMKNA